MREPENGTPGPQRDRKGRDQRLAAAVVMVGLVSLSAPACSPRNAERPAAEPGSKDIVAENVSGEVQGWIAYRDGSEFVAVDPADPTKTVSLVKAEDRALIDWSRDGTRLLLQGPLQDALYIVNADGSEARLTRPGLFIYGASFSPDGSMVAYGTDDGISVIEAEGGGTARLVAASDPSTMTWLQDPVWSPDGSRIAFVAYGELRRDYAISVVNADGTGWGELIDLRGHGVAGLAWSPDGSQLFFSNLRGIYAVGEDGSGLRMVTRSRSSPPLPPEGSRTAFVISWLALSPDGSRVAFVEHAEFGPPPYDHYPLSVVNDDGTGRRQLIDLGASNPWGLAWLPEGAPIVAVPVGSGS
jgi:Tol biopolymer transport system component